MALPKGRIAQQALALLRRASIAIPESRNDRKLIIDSEDGALQYIMSKPTDVPTFVEHGAADIGVCGLDTLRENGNNVYEPLLLPFGYCRLSVCGMAERPNRPLRYESQPRIATKFPNLALRYFRERNISAEIIPLHGSVELGPLVGLADLIVDLVETGTTLRDNGLVELRTILDIQAVLIVNRAAYRLKSQAVQKLLAAIRKSI